MFAHSLQCWRLFKQTLPFSTNIQFIFTESFNVILLLNYTFIAIALFSFTFHDIFKDLFIFISCIWCSYIYFCPACVPVACKGQNLDILELDLKFVESCCVGAENQIPILGSSQDKPPNCLSNLPVWYYFVFCFSFPFGLLFVCYFSCLLFISTYDIR